MAWLQQNGEWHTSARAFQNVYEIEMTVYEPEDTKILINNAKAFLATHRMSLKGQHLDLVLKRSFNEVWFSNMLAWLLDTKGTHGLGVRFANEFLAFIARQRSNTENGYERKSSYLKNGREGLGQGASGFGLGNASVAREFYLAGEIGRSPERGARFCDVAFIDLDRKDGIFVAVENKLFTTNHRSQLEDFYHCIEDRFRQARVREYVYLTLFGEEPKVHKGTEVVCAATKRTWVRCSWTNDIPMILEKCKSDGNEYLEIDEFVRILIWLKKLHEHRTESGAEELSLHIKKAAAYCLEEELNRLDGQRTDAWSIKEIADPKKGNKVELVHSANPKSPLLLELLPSLSIAVQGRRAGKASFEKIVIPYGVNTDQIFNMLDITARDICKLHFEAAVVPKNYLNPKSRRISSVDSKRKQEVKPLFDFVAANYDELKVLFTVSRTSMVNEGDENW